VPVLTPIPDEEEVRKHIHSTTFQRSSISSGDSTSSSSSSSGSGMKLSSGLQRGVINNVLILIVMDSSRRHDHH